MAGPEKITQPLVEVQPLAGLPNSSSAVTVTSKSPPAVCVPGFGTVKWSSGPGVTATAGSDPVFVSVSPAKLFASKALVTHVYVVADVGAVAEMSTLTDAPGGIGLPVFSRCKRCRYVSVAQPDSFTLAGVL